MEDGKESCGDETNKALLWAFAFILLPKEGLVTSSISGLVHVLWELGRNG